MSVAEFLRPNKWRIISFLFLAFLAFTIGYNTCASPCTILDAICVDVCVVHYSFILWPLAVLHGPNDHLGFSAGAVLRVLLNGLYWYVASCFIVEGAKTRLGRGKFAS